MRQKIVKLHGLDQIHPIWWDVLKSLEMALEEALNQRVLGSSPSASTTSQTIFP